MRLFTTESEALDAADGYLADRPAYKRLTSKDFDNFAGISSDSLTLILTGKKQEVVALAEVVYLESLTSYAVIVSGPNIKAKPL